MSRKSSLPTLLAGLCVGALAMPAHAEGPMNTYDAGTLARGGMKLEAVWSFDDDKNLDAGEAVYGFSVIENLEFALSAARERDDETKAKAGGFTAKWVPIQRETGWSLGASFAYGQARETDRASDDKTTARDYALTGLASYRMENGQVLHLNLSVTRAKNDAQEWDNVGAWSLGYEFPLMAKLRLTADVFGEEGGDADAQLGLRYEIAEGLKVFGALGHGNHRDFGTAGVAWEF